MLNLQTVDQVTDFFTRDAAHSRFDLCNILKRVLKLLNLEESLMDFACLLHVVFELRDIQHV